MVNSEANFFYQNPCPRNLGNSSVIAFVNLESRPSLPSIDEFTKAKYVIGEFLQPSYAEPLSLTKIKGSSALTMLAKDFAHSSPITKPSKTQEATPNDFSLPSSTDFLPEFKKSRRAQALRCRPYASRETKILRGGSKLKDSPAEGSVKKSSEQEPPQKKANISEASPIQIVLLLFLF